MDFHSVLSARHSVRDFDGRPVPVETLRAIVEDAQKAPSWVNAQEWRVWIAVGDKLGRIRASYAKRTAAGIKGNSDFAAAHREQWSAMAQENMALFSSRREKAGLAEVKEASQAQLFHAPAVAYLTVPKTASHWALLDLGGFEQTLLLAACARGVDSVPAYNLIKYPDILRDELGIPDDLALAVGVALGYAKDVPLNAFRSTRRAVDEILTIVDK